MTKKYMFIASILLSSACLASSPFINDLENQQQSKPLILGTQNFVTLIRDFYEERMKNTDAPFDISVSNHLVNSNSQIDPKDLKAEDLNELANFMKLNLTNTSKSDALSIAKKIEEVTHEYWDLFQNLRVYLRQNDVKYFDIKSKNGPNRLSAILSSLKEFTYFYEPLVVSIKIKCMSGNQQSSDYKNLQHYDQIARSTWKIFINAYHKFGGCIDNNMGPLLDVNGTHTSINDDGGQKFLFYIRNGDDIRPLLVYSHAQFSQNLNLYETYSPRTNFEEITALTPVSTALFRYNENGFPEIYDRPMLTVQRVNSGSEFGSEYRLAIYSGSQGIKKLPYASSQISLTNEDEFNPKFLAIKEDELTSDILEAISVTKNRELLDDRIINFAQNALDGQDFVRLELPNNRYEIRIQQKQFELAELLLLEQQYDQLIQDHYKELDAQEIQQHQIISAEINTETETLKQDLWNICQEQIDYEQEILRQQQDVSNRVINNVNQPEKKSNKSKNRPSQNSQRQHGRNSKRSTSISSSSTTTSNNNQELINQLLVKKEKLEKIIQDTCHNPQKAVKNLQFIRMINQSNQLSYLVDDDLKGQLNKSSHGKLTYTSTSSSSSLNKTQTIGVMRGHGAAKDNTVPDSQVNDFRKFLKEKIRTNINILNRKIATLKNSSATSTEKM